MNSLVLDQHVKARLNTEFRKHASFVVAAVLGGFRCWLKKSFCEWFIYIYTVFLTWCLFKVLIIQPLSEQSSAWTCFNKIEQWPSPCKYSSSRLDQMSFCGSCDQLMPRPAHDPISAVRQGQAWKNALSLRLRSLPTKRPIRRIETLSCSAFFPPEQ